MGLMAMRCATRRYRPPLRAVLLGSMIIVCLLVSACGGATPVSAPDDLIARGVLTVGSEVSYPPQEFLDPTTHQPTGFDVDLITAIAKRLNLQARIVPDQFNPLLDDLAAKRFDVVISAITITSERQKKADFIPYLTVGASLLVQKGNPKNIARTDDLCGLAVGVQDGAIEQGVLQSSSDNCQEQEKPAITLIIRPDQAAVIQLLSSGKVAATYQDSTVTDYFAKQDSAHFQVGGKVDFPAPEGIAVRKTDASMLNAIQGAYAQVRASGGYHQLAVKWGITSNEISGG